LTKTCLLDDITTRIWTIDKKMDDYSTSICIESTYKVSFYLVNIEFLGFSMASHPIAAVMAFWTLAMASACAALLARDGRPFFPLSWSGFQSAGLDQCFHQQHHRCHHRRHHWWHRRPLLVHLRLYAFTFACLFHHSSDVTLNQAVELALLPIALISSRVGSCH
jgi:hypothetical protein